MTSSLFKADAEVRGVPAAKVHETVALYDAYCALTASADAARSQKNMLSKEMGKLRSKQGGEPDMDAIANVTAKSKAVKVELASLERDLRVAAEVMYDVAASVPNRTHPAVPPGPEENAVTVRTGGAFPEFTFDPKDHVDLALALDIVDFKAAAAGSGRSFYYLKGDGALLELALINYAMSKLVPRGFTPLLTPDIVKEDAGGKKAHAHPECYMSTYMLENTDGEIDIQRPPAGRNIPASSIGILYRRSTRLQLSGADTSITLAPLEGVPR